MMLSASVDKKARGLKGWFWLLALALTIIAVARPQWGSDVEIVERQGVQLMVALDVSKSMLAEDLKPNRLGRAKLEIASLMNRLGGDEVGLVLFSGAAFLQFPLTFDYATARTFLDGANAGMISRPGTVVGEAIDVAIEGFDEQPRMHLSSAWSCSPWGSAQARANRYRTMTNSAGMLDSYATSGATLSFRSWTRTRCRRLLARVAVATTAPQPMAAQ
jgi:hypothetical protein